MQNFVLTVWPGDSFHDAAEAAKLISLRERCVVEFEFNGITCLVDGNTMLDLLARDFYNAFIMDWKTIGPDCPVNYSPELQQELQAKRLAADEQQQKELALMQEANAKMKALVEEKTANVTLLIHPEKADEYREYVAINSNEGYSRAVVDYAEAWAKLMQVEVAKGRTEISLIADECQRSLGYMGITGFQYGCVVQSLAHFWVFGEELRQWHNAIYNAPPGTTGTVNPAILTIKTNE